VIQPGLYRALALGLMGLVLGASGAESDPNPGSQRPPADLARDAARKPAEMVAFAKIKPGQTVVDALPGGGYFTRVLSDAVGPSGRVIAFVPDMLAARSPKAVEGLKALAQEPGRSNVAVTVGPMSQLALAGTADRVWTAQNYHDLHNPAAPADTAAVFDRAAFTALKPGGYLIIEDHVAEAGSGVRDAGTLHRIDPATIRSEVLAAGFTFEGETHVLRNPDDDHSKSVFDPSLRGRTDQIVYRFRKPR
jgi:predicted methyltransferase